MQHPETVGSIRDYFTERSDAMVAELREFVERETPSRDAASIEGFILDYSRRLEEAGLSCRQFPGAWGPQLLAEL
ncbi:MAG: hypothetical protein VCD34_06285, partial [Planctomycetota bacterium]